MNSASVASEDAGGLRILPVGESAVLVECREAGRILALYERMRDADVAGVVDLVPAELTLLMVFDPNVVTRTRLAQLVAGNESSSGSDRPGAPEGGFLHAPVVDIDVRYDGPDLEEVLKALGLAGVDELIRLHTGQVWTAAFVGFAPGFAYLRGEHDRLDLPRRASPRASVPAGAVALAAGYCGIYPRPSPGGWHLIGTTAAPLWDAAREPASLLEPGSRVRFHRAG